jgi:pSer/pThr/pTyr-binding forkhead associated (FHA) protein
MIICKTCQSVGQTGALFCAECGDILLDFIYPQSEQRNTPELAPVLPQRAFVTPALLGHALDATTNVSQFRFVIISSGRQVTLEIDNGIVIGRQDPESGFCPELDLTPDEGLEWGVSRQHAAIQVSHLGIMLTDLGSVNGTFLNDLPIPANLPYALRHGDKVQFGDLLVEVYFG